MAVSLNSVIIHLNPSARFKPSISGLPLNSRKSHERKRQTFYCSASNDNNSNDTKTIQTPYSNYPKDSEKTQPSDSSNGTTNAADQSQVKLKKSPLTARERVRAARVLSRYTDSPKPPAGGSRLLDALQEKDKVKRRSGLPEAPTNLFDDSKRGMPKEGWTFNIFPGGMDVFFIVFSFVLISSIMFATTYIVWKVGAIHFNEY